MAWIALKRLRFSLRVLLWLVAGASLLLVTWNNYRVSQANRALKVVNRRLRDEVGEVTVEDPTLLHVIQVPPRDGNEWAFRLWIPEGREYRARVVGDRVPAKGFPADGGTIMLGAGEQVLRYRIVASGQHQKYVGTLSSHSAAVGGFEQPWLSWPSLVSLTSGIGKTTTTFPPGEVVEICRHRVSQADSSTKIEDPSEGFLIWLEPVK